MRLDSPFPPERLGLLVQDRIATDYRSRAATFDAVASAIATLAAGRTGNYLAFFPSYQYLARVRERFAAAYPEAALQAQRPGMSAAEADVFLAAFQTEPARTQIGFAVLGGVFGEGIDLVGDRLTGAVVVGVGLPQVGLERELIRGFFQQRRGAGFEYAYVFPGINRVLQAGGRVIRSETDRGVVLLIDTRFGQDRYPPPLRALVASPATWATTTNWERALAEFWGDQATAHALPSADGPNNPRDQDSAREKPQNT